MMHPRDWKGAAEAAPALHAHGLRVQGEAGGVPPRRHGSRAVIRGAFGALALGVASSLLACTAASPTKPPPPPIQTPGANPNTTIAALAATPAAQVASASTASGPPTLPPIVVQAAAEAPPPPGSVSEPLPSARELANGTIAALNNAKTARLLATLASGNRTDLVYVAPDRAALVEQDPNNREVARYVIIADTGYQNVAAQGAGWTKRQHPDFRKQAQVFRAIQVALATGKPRTLESGAEVEATDWQGKPALRASFDYSATPELEELGLMRTAQGNTITVIVDPATWLPFHSQEETQGFVTQVDFVEFDQPRTIEAPIS